MYTLCFVAVVCDWPLSTYTFNVAVSVGNDVSLACTGSNMSWEEYVSKKGGGKTVISLDSKIFAPNKYSLSKGWWGKRYDLTIKSAQLNQAGQYKCRSLIDESIYVYLEVIVFKGEASLLFHPCCFYGRLYLDMYVG